MVRAVVVSLIAGLLGCATAPSTTRLPPPLKLVAPVAIGEPVEPLPIPLLSLRGSPEQIGHQHGAQLSDRIRTLEEKYLNVRLSDMKLRFVAMTLAAAFEPLIAPEHRAEVEALAQGAGLNPRVALLAQCFLDLTDTVACSTIALPPGASPDGVARMGRNLDFPSLGIAQSMSVVLVYHPADSTKHRFAAVGWPGLIGVLSGMNEHGLTLANMEVRRAPRYPSGMPYALLYRTILERCRTVDEAIDLINQTPRQSANNLMLMDASGNRAVVEIRPESVHVRHGKPDEPLISTNHHRGDTTTTGRCRRYDKLTELSRRDFGDAGVLEIESMLAAVQQGKMTLQSMVFEPSTRVMYLATGAYAASQKFYRVDLSTHFDATGN
jgi:hypothetical protein